MRRSRFLAGATALGLAGCNGSSGGGATGFGQIYSVARAVR